MAPRVLVVCDDAALVALLEYHLQREGFAVGVAMDTSAAAALSELAPPDLVVVDTDLAGFGVVAVGRALRTAPALRAAGVVAIVGGSETAASLARLGFAADVVLAKPFTLAELGQAAALGLGRRFAASGSVAE